MPPARTPRRRLAALSASAAGLVLAGSALAVPALADPPQGHPHGGAPGQSDQEPPAAPPEHAASPEHAGANPERSNPTPPTPPGAATSQAARADRPAAQPTPPPAPPADQGQGGAQGEEAPGNAGTVKVHEVGTADDDRRNEPKLCDFRIVGFGFPADAHLEVTIAGHGGPNAGPSTFDTEVATEQLSATGDWAIDGPTLEDGMYKLEVENTTAPGGPKQKVFKIDCPDDAGADAGGEEIVDDVVVDDEVTGDEEQQVLGSSETRVLGAYIERQPAEVVGSASTGGTGYLPRTGVELLTLAGGAAALVAGGTLLQRGARARR
ncbi:MAG: hypothetical protein ACLGI8_11165 [Acidimicrobiia bacterium]